MEKVKKILNNDRIRLWIYPKRSTFSIRRKEFKALGWIIYFGRYRLSITLIKGQSKFFRVAKTFETISQSW